MTTETQTPPQPMLTTLPGDEVRQIMWGFADRYDLHMLVQSTRAVARGPIAQLVAQGQRNTHDWTPEKNRMLKLAVPTPFTNAEATSWGRRICRSR